MREAVAAWLGWGRRAGGHDEEIVELTDQFYVTLEASFARVPGSLATGPAAARVQELLQTKARSWSSAYEIEQRLVQLYDDETVAAELELGAMEATGVLRKEQADHYAARTEALRKATEAAKRNLTRVALREGRTLHHDIAGRHGAGRVYLRAAPAGTGIIAGGPMRAVFETLGVKDIVAKSVGTSNPHNMIKATFAALQLLNSPRMVATRRGKKVGDLLGRRDDTVVEAAA